MLPWQRYIRQLNHQKVEVCVVNLLIFLVTKGSRVLEKNVNETEVSKTVFSHLKLSITNRDDDGNEKESAD